MCILRLMYRSTFHALLYLPAVGGRGRAVSNSEFIFSQNVLLVGESCLCIDCVFLAVSVSLQHVLVVYLVILVVGIELFCVYACILLCIFQVLSMCEAMDSWAHFIVLFDEGDTLNHVCSDMHRLAVSRMLVLWMTMTMKCCTFVALCTCTHTLLTFLFYTHVQYVCM